MSKTVLLFGTKFDLIKRLKAYGLKVILVDEFKNDEADISLVVDGPKASVGDYDVDQFSQYKDEVEGLIVCLEDYVELAAATREKYFNHLLGLTVDQAILVRDKLRLKQFLHDNDIPVARFSDLSDYDTLIAKVGLPFVVKPRLGFLAQGIEVIRSQSDFEKWQNGPHLALGGFYAEEYIEKAIEYCCDTIVADSQIIAQFPGEYTVSCLESNKTHEGFGVNFPGFLASEELEKIKIYTQKFIKKLGVADGFFHTEYLWKDGKWYFGESGCRLPGGLQIPVESYVSGLDIMDLYIKMFVPHLRPKEIAPVKQALNPYAGYYLFPKKVGKVTNVRVSGYHSPSNIRETKLYVKVGDHLKFEDSSVTMAAHMIYSADNIDAFKKLSHDVKELVTIEYEYIR